MSYVRTLKARYPDMASIDKLQSEYDKRNFILAFRDIIRKHSEIQVYEEWNADDSSLVMTEQEYNDYRSKYLDMTMGFIQDDEDDKNEDKGKEDEGMAHEDPTADIDDIDFCPELLHSDVINVAYILELIEDLNPASDDYQVKRQNIIDTMIKRPCYAQ